MSIRDLSHNDHLDDQEDDCADDAPPTDRPDDHVPPDAFAAALVLRRSLPRAVLRRMRRGAPTCLVLLAPSADWCGPLKIAAAALFGHGRAVDYSNTPTRCVYPDRLLFFVRPAPDRSGRPDASGDSLADCLSRGGSAVGVAADPSLLPAQVVEAAAFTIDVAPLDGRQLARVIRATTRCTRCPPLDDALARRLTSTQVGLAVRAHTTPAQCVARLRAMVDRRAEVGDDDTPRLEDLAGYGEVMDWALALKSDIEKRRADPSVPL